MDYYSFNSKSSFGSDFSSLFDPFKHDVSGFGGDLRGGAAAKLPHSLVLDSEKGELVKAPARVGKKELPEAKALLALKNHSEAERRRRERINAHLSTLRGLVPCTEKMDKATLLAAVISQVKELKKDALESSKGFLIPVDADEVKIEPYVAAGDGTISVKASVCCEYRSELLSDLRKALDSLHLKMVKAEIATLGDRVKNVFVLTSSKPGSNDSDAEAYELLASSVHQVLSSVLDKASASSEYSPRTTLPSKRRRLSYFDKIDTSSSSS